MKLHRWIYPILVLCMLYATFASASDREVMSWTVAGVQRQAIVYSPRKKTASGKAPLMFAFHGHGDTMENFEEGTEFQGAWPEAVVVYMQGLPTNPATDPQGYGWIYEPNEDAGRDLAFFDAVLKTMREKFPVDNQRIYATGFSQGAMFTYVLWGTRANVFAGLAVVAGRILPTVHMTDPKPVLVIAGEQDTTVKYKDQVQAMRVARTLNGVDESSTSCGHGCSMYASSKGTPVITYIHGGGHIYPDDATARIVKFFRNFTLVR